MSNRVELIVSGDRAGAAAEAVALGLVARGATVSCPDIHGMASASAQGLKAMVRVQRAAQAAAIAAPFGVAGAAKAMVGGILLLALLGAEVKLHFGVRLDTFVTLLGILVFWRACLRARQTQT